MSIENEVFATLRALVSDRVYPNAFPQPNGGLPTWPAIRYIFISGIPGEDLCGDGEDETDDVDIQFDLVAEDFDDVQTLRRLVRAAMKNMPTLARLQFWSNEFDDDTQTYRVIMTYTVQGSSDP